MKFYQFSPQCVGTTGEDTICADWSARPVVFHKLQFELEYWPEDDFIGATIQAYAGTIVLANAIEAAGLTGIKFDRLEMIKGDQFWLWEEEHLGETIPEYLWFKFSGNAGIDDFGMIHAPVALPLTVSEKALAVLKQFKIENCRIKDFDPSVLIING
ncbi:hypothetical protein KBI23_07955 [bacterium]|jgi:hypothetical protein|nr:hypothetical protein [bacterium]MBP9090948.1 hypothetical protein [bacterium]MBP9808968.1 hypothetical protein [bacterium]